MYCTDTSRKFSNTTPINNIHLHNKRWEWKMTQRIIEIPNRVFRIRFSRPQDYSHKALENSPLIAIINFHKRFSWLWIVRERHSDGGGSVIHCSIFLKKKMIFTNESVYRIETVSFARNFDLSSFPFAFLPLPGFVFQRSSKSPIIL